MLLGFADFSDREHAIDFACQWLTEILKRRDKKEEILAAFRVGVAKFRTVLVPHTSTGLEDVKVHGILRVR